MSAIAVLKNEYPGDKAWEKFVSVFLPEWKKRFNKEDYFLTIPDEELAIVLSWSMGLNSINWYLQPCKGLDNRAPKDVLENEVMGVQVLRTLLMRMPI